MQKETLQENKMGVMPVGKLLVNMALPMIISMLVQAFYNIVDSVYVSQVSESAVTALSLAFPVQNMQIGFAVGVGVGVNALLSQSLGRKDQESVNWAAGQGVFLALAATGLFMLFGFFGVRPYYTMQSTVAETVEGGIAYTSICCIFTVGVFIQVLCERLLQATGRAMQTMILQGTGAIINIILDPVFIHGWWGMPRMGVAGAAIATDISQLVSCVLSLRFLIKSTDDCRVIPREIRLHKKMAARIIRVGLPTGIQNMVISFSNVLVQASVNSYGAAAMAGFAAYMKIDGFNILPVSSISMAATTFVGQNYGAGRLDRVKRSVWVTLAIGVIYTLCTGAALLAGQDAILHLFTADEAVVTYGKLAMRWFCPFYFLLSILHGLAGAVRGTGASIPPMVVLLVSLCLFRVVWIQFLLPFFSGIEGVFILYPVSWGLGAVLMILYAWKGKWMEYHT